MLVSGLRNCLACLLCLKFLAGPVASSMAMVVMAPLYLIRKKSVSSLLVANVDRVIPIRSCLQEVLWKRWRLMQTMLGNHMLNDNTTLNNIKKAWECEFLFYDLDNACKPALAKSSCPPEMPVNRKRDSRV